MRQNKVGEQKVFKKFGRFSFIVLMSVSALHAGSFEDFKRTQQESFQQYKDEKDAEFNNYLKEQWKAYKEFAGQPLYEKPKPKVAPKTTFKQPESVGPKIIIKTVPVVKQVPSQPQEETPKVVQAPQEEMPTIKQVPKQPEKTPVVVVKEMPKKKDIMFSFYGSNVGFDIDKKIKTASFSPRSQEGIAAFFDVMASSNYEDLVTAIQTTKDDLKLNDWGLYLLVNDVSKRVFNDADEATLLSWFLFNKLGYAVRIGLVDRYVVMLNYSAKTIYSTPNYTLDNKKYYALAYYNKGNVGRLYTYRQDYPDATKPLDLALVTIPAFPDAKNAKTLQFQYQGKSYKVSYDYNKNLIDFMASYPQADYATYFDAPVEQNTYAQIADEFKKYLDGKRASDAMNFVLSFVQHAFKYETDPQQFGREKPMFAQETLYYNASDCEDRAVLYAYLMKKLFHVNVVGIKYKDHMATALQIPMQGDALNIQKKRYVIADPTYINASIGQSMPQYKSIMPESFIRVQLD